MNRSIDFHRQGLDHGYNGEPAYSGNTHYLRGFREGRDLKKKGMKK